MARRGNLPLSTFGLNLPLIREGDELVPLILSALREKGLSLFRGDIVVVASKALSASIGSSVNLSSVKPSSKAHQLARDYDLEPRFVELVIREADEVFGGVSQALLTIKGGNLIANAGIDQKNAGRGLVALWPRGLEGLATKLRRQLEASVKKRIGVMIIDSRTTPSRMGTTGFCLAASGFETVLDCRGEKDLFGRRLVITRMAIADDLAAVAHLLMGEGSQRNPIAIIKNAPIKLSLKKIPMTISPSECLFLRVFDPNPILPSN